MVASKVRGHLEKFEGQIVTAADPLRSCATLTEARVGCHSLEAKSNSST
jgi:hypothetical protein